MFGSGRAILSLRDDYRHDLREIKRITDFEYVRFHAIFHDEVGLYDEDANGKPVYNFSYVDQIYDGLLANKVRPFVELSFMPKKLTSDPNALHAFWYKQNVAPPKDWDKWGQLIEAFTRHLVERYGIEEVSQWYFEVWNEPNLDFWVGNPKEETYYPALRSSRASRQARQPAPPRRRTRHRASRLGRHLPGSLQGQKHSRRFRLHARLRQRQSRRRLRHPRKNLAQRHGLPFGEKSARPDRCFARIPKMPLIWTEYNAAYDNETAVTDSAYMGPYLANTIRECDGLADIMSYWTFSDVFEEQGVVKTPFYGGFGLLAERDIPKPSFNDFALLHRLGDTRLDAGSDSLLVTRRKDGSLVIAAWNLFLPEEAGSPKSMTFHFKGVQAATAKVTIVDKDHGSPLPHLEKARPPSLPYGRPNRALRKAAALPAPKSYPSRAGSLYPDPAAPSPGPDRTGK